MLTSCSYRQTVEVISRDAEKNNKKASEKMGDEGRGQGKEKETDEGRKKGERADFGNVVVVIFYDDEKTSLQTNS